MAAPIPARKAEGFMSLPAEVRLGIYSCLISSTMLVNLCDLPSRKGCSPVSELTSQSLAIETISRSNGLHLQLVSRRIRREVAPLLHKRVVRFHCPRCFTQWLRNLYYLPGVGVNWMRHFEIEYDNYQPGSRTFGPADDYLHARNEARNTMVQCRGLAYGYCGLASLVQPVDMAWQFDLGIEYADEHAANTASPVTETPVHPTQRWDYQMPSLDFLRDGGTFRWIICGQAWAEDDLAAGR